MPDPNLWTPGRKIERLVINLSVNIPDIPEATTEQAAMYVSTVNQFLKVAKSKPEKDFTWTFKGKQLLSITLSQR